MHNPTYASYIWVFPHLFNALWHYAYPNGSPASAYPTLGCSGWLVRASVRCVSDMGCVLYQLYNREPLYVTLFLCKDVDFDGWSDGHVISHTLSCEILFLYSAYWPNFPNSFVPNSPCSFPNQLRASPDCLPSNAHHQPNDDLQFLQPHPSYCTFPNQARIGIGMFQFRQQSVLSEHFLNATPSHCHFCSKHRSGEQLSRPWSKFFFSPARSCYPFPVQLHLPMGSSLCILTEECSRTTLLW